MESAMTDQDNQEFSKAEITERRDAAIRRALNTPPEPKPKNTKTSLVKNGSISRRTKPKSGVIS
jgi:hypothetical protein